MLAQVILLVLHSSSPKNSGRSLLRYNGLFILGALLKKKNLIYSKLILDFLEVFFSSLKMRYNGCWNSQESGPIMPCFIKLLIIFFPVIFAKIQTVEGRVGREATSFISGDFPLTFPFPMELQRVSHCNQGQSHGGKRPLFYIFLLSMKLSAG